MYFSKGLTHDDVLLLPRRSSIDHRGDVSTATYLTPQIKLHIPLISANMDTVTEGNMAIALAREGGIGIIHRFMSIEEEVGEVRKVKRAEGFILDNPYTVKADSRLGEVIHRMNGENINGFIVVDDKGKVVGVLSRRDYIFETNKSKKVYELMTPFSKLIIAKVGTTFASAKKYFINTDYQ